MAQTVGGVVGAAVGFFVGGPSGAQWGWAIGAAIGNSFTTIKTPRIGDLANVTAGEGGARARTYGTFRPIGGQVVWSGKPREIRTRQRSGKGGPKVETSTVLRSYAIGICEGPITGVQRIWRNNELVYDVRIGSEMLAESAKWLEGKNIVLGDWEQLPHPTIEAESGAANAPAMRGTAYLMVTDEDLTDLRGAIPAYQFETSINTVILREFWNYSGAGADLLNDVAWFEKSKSYLIVRGGVADVPKIFSTKDGVSLTPRHSTTQQLVTVVTSPDWAVARAAGSAGFSSSTGISWTSFTAADSQSYTVGLWTGVRFLFCGTGDSAEYSAGADPSGWVSSPRPANQTAVRGVAVPGSGEATCVVFCQGGAIHRTTNGGTSWTTSTVSGDLQPTRTFIAADYGQGVIRAYKTLNAQTWIYTSTDLGATFDCVEYTLTGAGDVQFNGLDWVMTGVDTTAGFENIFVRTSDTGLPPFTSVAVQNYPNAEGSAQTRVATNGESTFVIGRLSGGSGFTLTIGTPILDPQGGTPALLGDILESVCLGSGLGADKIEIAPSLASQTVEGFATSPDYSAVEAVRELAKVYYFDLQDSDGKVKFVARGGNFARTIDEGVFVSGEDEPETDTTRDSLSVPRLLHLSYFDIDGGQGTDKQFSERQISPRAESPTVLSTPVVLAAASAARAVRVQHQVMEEELRGELVFGVSDQLINLAPADVIVVQYRGRSQRCRITKLELMDGWQRITAVRDRQSAYSATVQAIPPAVITLPPSTIVGATRFAFLDIPALTQAGDVLSYHVATSGEVSSWRGAVIEREEAGAQFSVLATDGTGTVMGTLTTALPLASEFYPDNSNVLRVQLARADDELEGITNAQWLSRGNAAALVRADGTAEIIQFRDAVETTPGTWALSGLQRGRLNSGASAHSIGAVFVLLEGALLVQTGTERLATTINHRAYSFGNNVSTATAQARTWTGRSQREWPPIIETAVRTVNTMAVTWTPRHRFGSDELPVPSAQFIGWRVEATSGGTTVGIDTLTPTASLDVTGLSNPITVTVRGRNRLTGNGDAATRIVP